MNYAVTYYVSLEVDALTGFTGARLEISVSVTLRIQPGHTTFAQGLEYCQLNCEPQVNLVNHVRKARFHLLCLARDVCLRLPTCQNNPNGDFA